MKKFINYLKKDKVSMAFFFLTNLLYITGILIGVIVDTSPITFVIICLFMAITDVAFYVDFKQWEKQR